MSLRRWPTQMSTLPSRRGPPTISDGSAPRLRPHFTPAALGEVEPALRELAAQMVDDVAANGSCEVMNEVALPYPYDAFLVTWGLPLGDRDRLIRWNDRTRPAKQDWEQRGADEQAYLRTVIADRRCHPGPGMLSKLLTRLRFARRQRSVVADDYRGEQRWVCIHHCGDRLRSF